MADKNIGLSEEEIEKILLNAGVENGKVVDAVKLRKAIATVVTANTEKMVENGIVIMKKD